MIKRIIKYEKNNRIRIWVFGIKIVSLKKNKKLKRFKLDKYSDWINDLKNNKSHFVKITDKPYKRQKKRSKDFRILFTAISFNF